MEMIRNKRIVFALSYTLNMSCTIANRCLQICQRILKTIVIYVIYIYILIKVVCCIRYSYLMSHVTYLVYVWRRDYDGMLGNGFLVSMYTTKAPIDMWRFNVPQLKEFLAFSVRVRYQLNYFICVKDVNG
jgi:hypothetical protein